MAAMLEKFGIEYYLPLTKKLRLWSDRKKWVEMPLFNGYVFVKPKHGERDRALDIPGVVKYVKYNGTDAIVSNREIEFIQRLVDTGYNLEEAGSEHLCVGEKVIITQGPMKGIEGVVIKAKKGDYSVYINFETIAQSLKIKIDRRLLTKSQSSNRIKNTSEQ